MIIANFCKTETYKNLYGLWQYDYGQALRIQGLELPTAVEIHFSLQEKGGEAVTRVGTTKDGVTDVTIPDTMLENNGSAVDYFIYAFIYIIDATSGQTEYKISMQVKARPKPEGFDRPEDAELFREAIAAVNAAADRAETAEKEAEGWAHGREDMPEKAEDNAKYYAGEAAKDAEQTSADRKEVERLVESVAGIDEDVELVRGYKEAAEEAAEEAAISAQESEESRKASETAKTAAEDAQKKAEEAARSTAEDRTAVEQAKTDLEGMKSQVTEDKTSIEQTAAGFTLTVQQAVIAVNNTGQAQTESVQGAGNTAVQEIQTAKEQAIQNVETTGTEQVQVVQNEGTMQINAVQQKGQEVLDSIPEDFSTQMAGKLDKNQGEENSGKVLVVGEDGTVTPGETPIKVDSTLTQSGQAADAKATGDTITALAIKNQVSGAVPIIITDSAEYPIQDLEMEGWTEQASTTGAQLINQDETVIGGLTGNTGSEFDGTNRIRTGFIRVEPNTTYIISGLSGFNIANSFAYDSEKTMARIGAVTTTTTTTTLENESYLRILFSKPDQSDFTEEELQKLRKTLMFNKGDVALPWEPYTGGQPSPSPDYPQEIVNAGKYNEETQKWEYEAKVQGKNLFNPTEFVVDEPKVIAGRTYVLRSDGGIEVTTQDSSNATTSVFLTLEPIYLPEGTSILVSGNPTKYAVSVQIVDEHGEKVHALSTSNGFRSLPYVLKKGEYIKWIWLYGKAGISDNGIMYIQLEIGDTATEYELPKVFQTVLLQSDRPLTKWDRLEKRDGQWGWVFKSFKKVYTGAENWQTYDRDEPSESGFYVDDLLEVLPRQDGYCSCFKVITEENINRGIWIGANNTALYTVANPYYNAEAPDKGLNAWKSYLTENNMVVVSYGNSETFMPLTESEQSALNALHTNYPTTVLVNDQGCEMSLEYVADTKNYIDQKIQESIQQSIAGNLLSTNSNQSLSAPMGAALNLRIEALEAKIE